MRCSKRLFFLLSILLLIGVFSLTENGRQASELKEQHNQIQLANFVEDIGFKEKTQAVESRLSDTLSLYVDWVSMGYSKEETFYYDIPEEFYLINDINFDLIDSRGQIIGYVVVSAKENQLQIHLTGVSDQLEKNEKRSGRFYFTVKLNPELWEDGDDKKSIILRLGSEEKELFVTLLAEESPSEEELLFLWGKYDKHDGQVKWETRLNYRKNTIEDIYLEFELDSESTFLSESVEVFVIENGEYVLLESKPEIFQLEDRWIFYFPNVKETHKVSFKTASNKKQTTISAKLQTKTEVLSEIAHISSDKTKGESLLND